MNIKNMNFFKNKWIFGTLALLIVIVGLFYFFDLSFLFNVPSSVPSIPPLPEVSPLKEEVVSEVKQASLVSTVDPSEQLSFWERNKADILTWGGLFVAFVLWLLGGQPDK